MSDDAHKVCELEKEVVRLNQKIEDNDKAVVLLAGISAASQRANLAMILAAIGFILTVIGLVMTVFSMLKH